MGAGGCGRYDHPCLDRGRIHEEEEEEEKEEEESREAPLLSIKEAENHPPTSW